MKRILNIINRAVRDYDFQPDLNDTLQDIWDQAENCITENIGNPDRIEECETNKSYSHIWWEDGKGFSYEMEGELISSDRRNISWYRKNSDGTFHSIPWYKANDDDYALMDLVFDSDGQYVALVAK